MADAKGGGFLPRLGQAARATVKAVPSVLGVSTGKEKVGEDLETFRAKKRIEQEVKQEFKEISPKEQIETKLLEAVAKQLGVRSDDVEVTEEGSVAIKADIDLPPGTTITVGGVSVPVVPKKSGAQEKREVEKKQLSDELSGLFESFARATEEGKAAFGGAFGARGLLGRATGKLAGIKGRAGFSPAIDVFNAKRKAFATVVAKAAGEVRPTDVDIERFVETLMSTERSDEENELIMQDLLKKVEAEDREGLRQLWENATGRKIGGETTNLPGGITEEDIQFTMQKHGLSREGVLEKIGVLERIGAR